MIHRVLCFSEGGQLMSCGVKLTGRLQGIASNLTYAALFSEVYCPHAFLFLNGGSPVALR